VFDIGELPRIVGRAIGDLRVQLQSAFIAEKKSRGLTQQAIATTLGVNRSVINRQLRGEENLEVKSVVALAWAMGWETNLSIYKPQPSAEYNEPIVVDLPKNEPVSIEPQRKLLTTTTGSVHIPPNTAYETKDVKIWPTQQSSQPLPVFPGSGISNTAPYIPIPT